MHLAQMEFIGYHVFNEDYKELTPDQALFIDLGVMNVYATLMGADEKSKKEFDRINKRTRKYR